MAKVNMGEVIPSEDSIEVRLTIPRKIMGMTPEPAKLLVFFDELVIEARKTLAEHLEKGTSG